MCFDLNSCAGCFYLMWVAGFLCLYCFCVCLLCWVGDCAWWVELFGC